MSLTVGSPLRTVFIQPQKANSEPSIKKSQSSSLSFSSNFYKPFFRLEKDSYSPIQLNRADSPFAISVLGDKSSHEFIKSSNVFLTSIRSNLKSQFYEGVVGNLIREIIRNYKDQFPLNFQNLNESDIFELFSQPQLSVLQSLIEKNDKVLATHQFFEDLEKADLIARNKQLRESIYIDPLGCIKNRKFFDENIESLILQARRENKNLCLLMLDIDYFKLYNDSYGHQSGDDCLRQIATAINISVKRPLDIAARYGGEEFVVALYDVDSTGAERVANKIIEAVNHLNIPHKSSKVSEYVTVSIGGSFVNCSNKEECNSENLINMADGALYTSKSKGRNQFTLYDEKVDLTQILERESGTKF